MLLGLPIGAWVSKASHRLAYDDDAFDPTKGPRPTELYRISDYEDFSDFPWHYRIPFFGLLIDMVDYCHFGVLSGPGRCDNCATVLSSSEQIPILSFLRQGGRCAHCAAPIPRQHFWMEAITPFILGVIFSLFGFTFEALAVSVVALLGLLASIIDWNYQIIPDEVPTTGLALGLGSALGHTMWAFRDGVPYISLLEIVRLDAMADPWHLSWAIAGALVGGGALWLLQVLGAWMAGTQAMGSGDIKLAVALGTFVGPKGAAVGLFYAALLGAVGGIAVKLSGGGKREEGYTKFAFGPYICVGFLMVLILGADAAFSLYYDSIQSLYGRPVMPEYLP